MDSKNSATSMYIQYDKYMKAQRENSIALRILKLCAGNPGSISVFGKLSHATDEGTLEKIVETAEEQKWTAPTAWEYFKECNQNIELFIERLQNKASD